jgi:hypothetical protein
MNDAYMDRKRYQKETSITVKQRLKMQSSSHRFAVYDGAKERSRNQKEQPPDFVRSFTNGEQIYNMHHGNNDVN